MRNHLINIGLVLVIVAVLCGAFKIPAQAQSPQDIKPYQFGSFEVPYNILPGRLYKAVHQGCEIYIATVADTKYGPSVSIATGRGCK